MRKAQLVTWIISFLGIALAIVTAIPDKYNEQLALTAVNDSFHWSWTNAKSSKTAPIHIDTALVDQFHSGEPCCQGTYSVHLPLKSMLAGRLQPADAMALYIPAIGGEVRVRIDDEPVRLISKDYSSVGPIIQISPAALGRDNIAVDIDVKGPATNLTGIWKGAPLIGDLQDLLAVREHDHLFQVVFPLLDSIVLLVFALVFLIIHFSLKGRVSRYLMFSGVLASWAVFYFFLSGFPRQWNFSIGTTLHYPARIIASFGLFALIAGYVQFQFSTIRRFGFLFVALALVNACFGASELPIMQKVMLSMTGLISFYPIFYFRFRRNALLRNSALIYSVIALVGQTFDAIKLIDGLLAIQWPLPFLNRSTFLPLLLTSFGECILEFSSSHRQLRAHLFKVETHAKAALSLAKTTISDDNISSQLLLGRRLARTQRSSVAKRLPDGKYEIIGVSGLSKDAIGRIIDPTELEHMARAVDTGEIVIGEVKEKRLGSWKTPHYAVVPIPQTKAPPYLLLFSDPRAPSTLSATDIPYLSQFSSALWANLERSREYLKRLAMEQERNELYEVLDPNLYRFISDRVGRKGLGKLSVDSERGIVFFDQKGFSGMLEDMNDSDAGLLVGLVSEWVTQAAGRYGAKVMDFIGDAYMLEVFKIGAETTKAVALRTLDLVWTLEDTLPLLNQKLLENNFSAISFRFGAHLGTVAVVDLGFIRPGLKTVVGDNVNIAARLQGLAQPGRILASSDLVKHVDGAYALKLLPNQYVKGRKRVVEIHEVAGKMASDGEAA